ncbi:MAG: glycosyltransferase family 2 protein [bacterium]
MKKKTENMKKSLSVVVPLYNEKKNVVPLFNALKKVLVNIKRDTEIIFIDDGSIDGTREIIKKIAQNNDILKAVFLRKNFGQSAALDAGFRSSRGDIVVTMDGDLQNDPRDIPMIVEKIEQGYDVVSGWRKNRKDTLVFRKIPSIIANKIICSITDIRLHDTGCALKAYKKEVIDGIRLYGELHRFLPALTRVEGATIAEVAVRHHPRKYGRSKYNLTRTFRVLMDMVSLRVFLKHLRNPLRFFGEIGLLIIMIGLIGAVWCGFQILAKHVSIMDLNVPLTGVFLFLVAGFQFIFLGLIASLIVKTGERRGSTLTPIVFNSNEENNEE